MGGHSYGWGRLDEDQPKYQVSEKSCQLAEEPHFEAVRPSPASSASGPAEWFSAKGAHGHRCSVVPRPCASPLCSSSA